LCQNDPVNKFDPLGLLTKDQYRTYEKKYRSAVGADPRVADGFRELMAGLFGGKPDAQAVESGPTSMDDAERLTIARTYSMVFYEVVQRQEAKKRTSIPGEETNHERYGLMCYDWALLMWTRRLADLNEKLDLYQINWAGMLTGDGTEVDDNFFLISKGRPAYIADGLPPHGSGGQNPARILHPWKQIKRLDRKRRVILDAASPEGKWDALFVMLNEKVTNERGSGRRTGAYFSWFGKTAGKWQPAVFFEQPVRGGR